MINQNDTKQTGKAGYLCAKCGTTEYTGDYIRTTGGLFSKIFNIQNKKFFAVSCKKCGFTEIYKASTPGIENVVDFFMN